jgi:hypothetical protein
MREHRPVRKNLISRNYVWDGVSRDTPSFVSLEETILLEIDVARDACVGATHLSPLRGRYFNSTPLKRKIPSGLSGKPVTPLSIPIVLR